LRKLLKIFFHYFYHPLAWSYDCVATLVSVGRWKDWRSSALPYIHGLRVLELGFGTGHLQVEINQRGFQTFGLDESWQMIGIARKKLVKNRLAVMLSRGYAQFLPFATNSFDSVVATFPSEYIMDSRTLAEIWRVLKFSGRLIIIPTAEIKGGTLPDRVAKWLFRVTGQTGKEKTYPESLEKRVCIIFRQAGFQLDIHHDEVRGSLVLVVIADKTDKPGISTNL
jgi:ubiquinone/menaquinone biosynthesis C-methylase UbiE